MKWSMSQPVHVTTAKTNQMSVSLWHVWDREGVGRTVFDVRKISRTEYPKHDDPLHIILC
jgi:hypothetical protein